MIQYFTSDKSDIGDYVIKLEESIANLYFTNSAYVSFILSILDNSPNKDTSINTPPYFIS